MARPEVVETDDVRRLADAGAQLVEVLPADDYQREHLPGAISLPLTEFSREAVDRLDRSRPVIVYCYDHQCDLSARGAALLAELGFEDVHDYADSKTAWLARGLPAEGTVRAEDRAGAIADPAVPTCGPSDDITAVRARVGPDDELCVVTDADGIVLGTLRRPALALPESTSVLDAMSPAPTSVRPSILRHELAESMDANGETSVLVTTSGGELIGLITREALRSA